MRTGLTAVVSGLALLRFMRELLADWALLLVAAVLMLFGCFSFAVGAWRYLHVGRRLAAAEMLRISVALILALSAVLDAVTLATLVSSLLK